MGYSTLSLDKNVLEKVNKLYTEMNKGGVFRSKSTFIELIIDFFLENPENRKSLWRFWIERNPEIKTVLSALLGEGASLNKVGKERSLPEAEGSEADGAASEFTDELKEVLNEFEGWEDKEI